MDTKKMAKAVVTAVEDKKGKDILALEIRELSTIADYFVICSAGSFVQAEAIADNIQEKMQENGHVLLHKEGYGKTGWILLDYGDVIAHIFQEEERRFYNLEQLWGDAPAI